MIPTKTVRVHKKLYDNLAGIANQTGVSIGSVITALATFGCEGCGSQYMVDKQNYHYVQRKAKGIYPTCFHCAPENYTPERLAEVRGEKISKAPKIEIKNRVAPPEEKSVEHVS